MGQDQQTVGIPIGPDTSLVMAELIMQRCDEELLAKLPGLKGHRLIDDYELSFQTRTEAEDAFHILDTCLSEFELALNPKKTQVLELPLPLEAQWATELKQFSFSRNSPPGQAADLNNYFSKAYSLHLGNPGESVLQFAVAKLRGISIRRIGPFSKSFCCCVRSLNPLASRTSYSR
jgi:Reverse transcriptase (RNA-dependent DNA polymerase)